MKKIFYIALTIVLGLAGTSCDREKLTYDSEPGEISGKTGTLDLSSFDAIPNNDIKEIEKKPVRDSFFIKSRAPSPTVTDTLQSSPISVFKSSE